MVEIARIRTVSDYGAGSPGVATHFFTKTNPVGWDYFVPGLVVHIQAAYAELAAITPSSMTFETQGAADILESTTGELVMSISSADDSMVGTATDLFGPLAAGLCVTWRTAGIVNSHHVRGRTFLVPVWSGAVQADGTPSSGSVGLAEDFAAAMIATPTNTQAVVWSRPVKDPANPGEFLRLGSAHEMTVGTVKDSFAILRSRRD